MRFGYIRTSTPEQRLDLQIDALVAAGVERENIFSDPGVSGATSDRPGLNLLQIKLRAGDEVVVWKLDRIARNARNLLDLVDQWDRAGITFTSLTEDVRTKGPMGKAMLAIMGAMAQLERDQLVERIHAGMNAARDRGRPIGRPVVMDEEKAVKLMDYIERGLKVGEAANLVGVGRSTAYRYLQSVSAPAEEP